MKRMQIPALRGALLVRALVLGALLVLLTVLPIVEPLLRQLPVAQAALAPNPANSVASVVRCLQPGASQPSGFSYDAPRYATTCFSSAWTVTSYTQNGDPTLGDADGSDAAVVSFGNDTADVPGSEAGHVPEATLGQVGAVYGLANSSGSNPAAPAAAQVSRLFAGAYTKRLTRYGPGGPGGIYALNRANGSTSLYVQIPGVIPGPATVQPGPAGFPNTPGDGSSAFPNNALGLPYSPELGGIHSYQHDDTTLPLIGRVGLGDIALDADERYLYAVNLWKRQIVRIDTWAANPQSTLTVLPDVIGALQPCASRGGVQNYRPFGLLVTARSLYLGGVCSAESTQDRADLGARVDRYDLSTGTWSNALGFDLDTFDVQRGTLPSTSIPLAWQPWSTQKSTLFANNSAQPYPVPALSGIVAGEDGSMYVGLRDLLGDIGGSYRLPDQTGRGFGDLLRAPPSGTQGRWLSPSTTSEEFIDSDPALHNEQTWGAIAYEPGDVNGALGGTIVTTYGAPFRLNSGGAAWYSAAGGSATGREEFYWTGQNGVGDNPQTLAKTSGLGDLEPLCPESTIGDTVWRDVNGNGVQDAGEQGIPGVRLQLLDTQGNVLATVTTDAQGHYRFYIPPFQGYQLRIDPTQMGTGVLAGLVPTVPNAGGDAATDSNANSQGQVQGLVPTKNRERNLTYDIGLVAAVPGVDIRKAGPAQAVLGSQVSYTLDYTNTGNVRQAVTVMDDLPAGVTFVSASPPPTGQAGQRLTWAGLGPLDPGAGGQIAVVVQVDPAAAAQITNATTITGSVGGQDQDQVSTQVLRPNVTVVKDATSTVVAGQTLTYTLRVANTGTADARMVTVQDTLPAGVVLLSTQPAASPSGSQLTWSLGTLTPGAQQVLQVVVQVLAAAPASLTNTATITTTTPGDTPGDNTSTVNTQVLRADVRVVKRALVTFPLLSGSPISYTLDVSNAGAAPAEQVVLDDTVPPQISNVTWRCVAGCTASGAGNVIRVALGTLAPGASAQILVTGVAQTAQAREAVVNTAVVSTSTPESDTTNNRSTVSGEVARPDVAVSKDDGLVQVQPGQVLTYTVRLTNTGIITVPLVTLREVPPAGATGLARGGWTQQVDGSWTQPVGPLAPGQVVTRTFTMQLPIPLPAAAITNTVQAQLPGGDPTPGDGTGTDQNQVLSGRVGDTVWRDSNGDGIQQAGEQGLGGVPVQLLDPVTGRVLATTTTDAEGRYLFPGLPLGSYAVRIDPVALSGQLKGYSPTTPTAPSGTLTPSVPEDLRLDIGLRPPTTTQVLLAYFTVESSPEGPRIRWGTLGEERTKEFRVLRGTTLGRAVEVGRLPSVGSRGGDYVVVDRSASGPGTRYWLIEVERDGLELSYGSVSYGALVYVPVVRR